MIKVKITFVFIAIAISAGAQKVNSVALNEIYKLLDENRNLVDKRSEMTLEQINNLLATDFINKENYQNQIFEEELRKLHADVGLRLSASAQENLGGGFYDETRTFTTTRANVGLEWNVLRNGYRSNYLKGKSLENEKQLYDLELMEVQRQENSFLLYNLFIYLLNEEKLIMLSRRIDFLEDAVKLYKKLEASHLGSRSEVFLLEQKYIKSKEHFASFNIYNNSMRQAFNWLDSLTIGKEITLPILDLDLNALLVNSSIIEINEEKKRLKSEELLYRQKDENLIDFRVYARYNYSRLSENLGSRKFPSVGASLSMPVNLKLNRNRKIHELEYNKLEQQLEFEEKNREKELMNHFYEYRYTLNQYFENASKIEAIEYRLRLDSVKLQIEDFLSSPLDLIQHLENHSDLLLASIDLKQQLYLKILKIYTLSRHDNLSVFAKPSIIEKEEKALKSLVIRKMPESVNFLNSYIRLNDISTLYTDLELREVPRGILLKSPKTIKNLLIPVSDFPDLWSLEDFIQEVTPLSEEIILEDWEALEKLELNSLNRQL